MIPYLFSLRGRIARFAVLTSLIFPGANVFSQTLAFPGALGFGANVTGGRGGTVYHVTTLADSGTGSFRDAVSHSGRIIVFDVGGYVKLNSAVSCSGNLTIAGQTAPGGGIGFYGGEISFSSRSNVICRYIRVRPGSLTASSTDDALGMADARTMIFDHCSFEFGPWNNVDAVSDDWQVSPDTEITFQSCLDADPTGQQFGAHTESVSSTMTWVYSVFANSHNRNPLAKINNVFVNNVLYNCNAGYTTHTSTTFSHDLVNNYFISGPGTGASTDFPWFQVDDNQSIYYSGNLFDSDSDGTLNGSITTPYWYQGGTGTILGSPWSSVTTTIPTYNTATAYRADVSLVGALPHDQIDNLVISQMQTLGNGTTGTGAGTAGPDTGLYTSQTQTGLGNSGYGIISGAIGPTDSDGDGMPDYWEKAVGLNYLSASDATTIAANGYANIENYINWLGALHALTVTNTSVDVDLWQYTGGFTNASPTYTVSNGSNGVVTLTSGHIAHFVPTTSFSGLGSFQFSVVTSDSAYTNSVAVLVTPQSSSSGTGANLIWVGDGVANLWNVAGATNWFNGTNYVGFNTGDTVTFDDSGSDSPAINLSGTLSATAINVIADEQDYTFTGNGVLSGLATLYKVGAGNLFINTTNTFSGGVTIAEGNVQLGDGVSFSGNIGGNITNNDTLIFNNPGNISSSASISGSGVLIKNGAGAVTLSGTQTYTNTTTINAGTLQFSSTVPSSDMTNNGSLIFAASGLLNYSNAINGSGALTLNGSGMTVLSGANTFAGNLTNNSGMLVLASNSAAGAGTVVYTNGTVLVAAGVLITNNFSILGTAANDLCLMATNTGTAIWAGNVSVGGSAQWRPGSDGGTLEFVGSAPMGSHIFIMPRGSMIFASNAVASSTVSGYLGRDGSGNKRSSNITIRDNASVSMAGCSIGGGKVGGSVTITIQNSGALSLGAVDLHNIANSAAISSIRLNGGSLTASGFTKTLTSDTNVILFNGGRLIAAAGNASFLPAFTISSNLVQSGGAIIDDGGFAITIAEPLIHDPGLGSTPDGGLTKFGSGTLTLAANDAYSGPTVVNAGVLSLYAPPIGSISNSASIFIAAGATLDVSGGGTATMTLGSGKTLSGYGSIKGNFIVGSGATLSPGSNSIGTLTVTNSIFGQSLTLASGSTNIFEISHSPLTNDSAKIFGALTNGGTLIITNIGGSALTAGDSFILFNAASYTGSFTKIILPPLGVNLAWNTNALNTTGVISVYSIVPSTPPAFAASALSGAGFIFSGTGGGTNATFYLLGSTNLSAPITNWARLLTNQFDGNGNFNFTNPANLDSLQYFYLLQEP